MQTVELFSGTGSFSKVAKEKGHHIFRVENDLRHKAELHKDIFELQVKDLPKNISVLWASPPCTAFSVASLRYYWVNGKPKNKKTWDGIALVLKTIQLIKELKKLNPRMLWFIENPRGMLRNQNFLRPYRRVTVTYCQYGDNRQKPTDIWTNLQTWSPRRPCSAGDPCHETAKRGSKGGTQSLSGAVKRAVIPPALFEEIFKVIEDLQK